MARGITARYRPWTDAPVHTHVPWATLTYLAGSTALVLWYRDQYAFLPERVPQDVVAFWAFRIEELWFEPGDLALHLVISVWANYYLLQFLYVTALVALFGIGFERHEGWLRTAVVFYAASIAAAVVAGFILLGLDAASGAAWIDREVSRVWVGGSAGAYGLIGATAARARNPWGLLVAAFVWELGLGLVYLQSSTPLFHITALATGFLLARFAWPERSRSGVVEDAT